MGYRLYRQIRDFAPQDWTSGELVVALMIADSANEQTRRSYIAASDLEKLCRMGGRGVRKNLEKLAEKGFEFRVPYGKDSNGKPVYAVAGNGVEYQVPGIFGTLQKASAVAFGLVDNLADGSTAAGLSTDRGGTTVPARRNHSTGCRVRVPSDLDLKTISKPPQTSGLCSHNLSWKGAPA